MRPADSAKLKPKPESGPSYRDQAWRVSPRSTLTSARRYSLFVRIMKRALPMAALTLAVAVLLYALQSRESLRLAMTFERMGRIEGDLTMINPKLSGTDQDGLPFLVTATRAMQEARGSDRVQLEEVVADITLKDGNALHITAAKGVVDTKTHVLEVSGGIRFMSQDGYEARTESAVADLKAGTVHGENGIEARGSFGQITARRFALNRDTRQLRFTGEVRMLLNAATTLPSRRAAQ